MNFPSPATPTQRLAAGHSISASPQESGVPTGRVTRRHVAPRSNGEDELKMIRLTFRPRARSRECEPATTQRRSVEHVKSLSTERWLRLMRVANHAGPHRLGPRSGEQPSYPVAGALLVAITVPYQSMAAQRVSSIQTTPRTLFVLVIAGGVDGYSRRPMVVTPSGREASCASTGVAHINRPATTAASPAQTFGNELCAAEYQDRGATRPLVGESGCN